MNDFIFLPNDNWLIMYFFTEDVVTLLFYSQLTHLFYHRRPNPASLDQSLLLISSIYVILLKGYPLDRSLTLSYHRLLRLTTEGFDNLLFEFAIDQLLDGFNSIFGVNLF